MKKHSFLIAFVIVILFMGCNNPNTLIIGNWDMEFSYVNGVREKENIPTTLTIYNDGVFRQVVDYSSFKEDMEGTWEYNAKTDELILTYNHTSTVVRWQVETISENLLKVRVKLPGFVVKRSFIKKAE